MVQYYKENQLLQVNNAMFNNTVSRNDATGTPVNYHNTDARCVWFDLKTLKRFIYEIESQTCRACGSSDTLGIRMYYGSYPGSPEEWNEKYGGNLANMCHEYAQKHTLLMVPTIRKTGIDIDFDPQYMSTSCDPVAGWNRIDSMMLANKSLSLLMLSTLDVGAQNHGTLSPPPYDNVDASVTRQFYGTAFMNLVDDVPNTGEVLTQRCP
jgi:hypothetical protein